MSMMENEALQRWCPFVRVRFFSGDTGPAFNRSIEHGMYPGTQCIASKCMAWRWGYPDHETNESTGYCGLAGSPR